MDLDTCANECVVVPQQHPHDPQPGRRPLRIDAGRPARWRQGALAERPTLARARQRVLAAVEAARTVPSWLASLPCDSRDQLHSKEYALARLGLRWASDPAHDAVLAREIEAARRLRLASTVAPGNAATARPGPASARARWTGSEPDPADVAVGI